MWGSHRERALKKPSSLWEVTGGSQKGRGPCKESDVQAVEAVLRRVPGRFQGVRFRGSEGPFCRGRRQAGPSTASVCGCSKRRGWGVPQGGVGGAGGCVTKFCMGKGWVKGEGDRVLDASRQEAEVNIPAGRQHLFLGLSCY